MLREMVRVVKPSGAVVITDEVKHSYAWMREEHADVWLGFDKEQVEAFFHGAELTGYGYESLRAPCHSSCFLKPLQSKG